MDLGQQVCDMLPKELFDLKPGTFIKGIRLIDYSPLEGRCASLNVSKWVDEVRGSKFRKNYTLRTPWYSNPVLTPMNGQQAHEKLLSIYSMSFDEFYGLDTLFPEEQFNSVEWVGFDYDNPVGVHLGVFFVFPVSPDTERSKSTLVYSKLLRSDGEVGYIAMIAQNINNKDLELL